MIKRLATIIALSCLIAGSAAAQSISGPAVDQALRRAAKILDGLDWGLYPQAEEALAAVENATSADPAYLALRGRGLAQLRRFADAERYLEEATELGGVGHPAVQEARLVWLIEQKRFAEATPLAESLYQLPDKRQGALYYLGRIYLERDPKRASRSLEEALAQDPDDSRSTFLLYWACAALKEKARARFYYHRFLETPGGGPNIYRTAASRLILDGALGREAAAAEDAVLADPRSVEQLGRRAALLARLEFDGSLTEEAYWQLYLAAQAAGKAVQQRNAAFELGRLHQRANRYYEAAACFQKALEADNFFGPAKAEQEQALVAARKAEIARQEEQIDSIPKLLANRKRLEKKYKLVPPPFRQGIVFLLEGRHNEAVTTFENALKEAPGFAPARQYLIAAYLRRRLEKTGLEKSERELINIRAREECAALAKVEPGNYYVPYFQGVIANDREEFAEAIRYLETALAGSPGFADAAYEIVYARRKLGDYRAADLLEAGLLASDPAHRDGLNRVLFSR